MYKGIISLMKPSYGASYGALTTAWITATGESDATILGALNTFETAITSIGLSKFDVIYPMIGGSSSAHSYNFINPASNQIVWYGGWTHNSLGAKPNGIDTYGTTGYTPSGNSKSIGIFGNENVFTGAGVDFGSNDGGNYGFYAIWNYPGVDTIGKIGDTYARHAGNTDLTGLLVVTKNGTSTDLYTRGILRNSQTDATVYVVQPLYIGAGNWSGPILYAYRNFQGAFVGAGLNQTDVTNLTNAWNTLNTAVR